MPDGLVILASICRDTNSAVLKDRGTESRKSLVIITNRYFVVVIIKSIISNNNLKKNWNKSCTLVAGKFAVFHSRLKKSLGFKIFIPSPNLCNLNWGHSFCVCMGCFDTKFMLVSTVYQLDTAVYACTDCVST